ncbi:MAG: hypothetical protein H8D45_29730 [Bacteroidetes bacterium]|nr:hypothetical protein [Bacteroidota bacterium]
MNKLGDILVNPFLISAYLSIVIIIFLPDIFSKYKATIIDQGIISKNNGQMVYEDLDGDEESEQIILRKNTLNNAAVKISDNNDNIIGQWNFSGNQEFRSTKLTFGDYDQDGFQEIAIFTIVEDSVFLNIIEPFDTNGTNIIKKFITTVREVKGKIDFQIINYKFFDLDNDGYKEIIFGVFGGYSLQPRQLYAFNIRQNEFIKTPVAGYILYGQNLNVVDIDNDGFVEIINNCNAFDNIPDTMKIPFKDNSSWLVVFDHNLNFKFPPVEFPGYKSTLDALPILINSEYFILVLFRYNGVENYSSKLCLYSNKGKLVKERKLTEDEQKNRKSIFAINNKNGTEILLKDVKGNFDIINEDLTIKKKISINKLYMNRFSSVDFDLDLDGNDELLFWDYDLGQLLIMRNDFKDIVTMNFPVENLKFHSVSLKTNPGQNPLLYLQLNKRWY